VAHWFLNSFLLQIPEMDGFEATAAMREREKSHDGKHVPILAEAFFG